MKRFTAGIVGRGKAIHAVHAFGENKGQTACGKTAGTLIDGDTVTTCKSCQNALPSWSPLLTDEERAEVVEVRPSVAEAWDDAHDENAERAMATARGLDVWLEEGMVLVDPMLDGGLFVFERFGKDGAELREMRTGILHMVSQSYVTTWKYVPRPIELNQVWRSKETGALVRIIDTSREDVRLIGLDAEDVPFWLSRSMLAEHFVWAPQKGDTGEAGR